VVLLSIQHSIEASLICQFLLGLRDLNGRPTSFNTITQSIAFTTLPVTSKRVSAVILDVSGQVPLSDRIRLAGEPSRRDRETQLGAHTAESQWTFDGDSDISERGSVDEEAQA